jgi:hypothetical protein
LVVFVVWVLASNLAQLLHDRNLFLDGIFNLGDQRRICISQKSAQSITVGTRKKLTAGTRSRVDTREKALSSGDGTLETLDYLSEVVADAGFFIELLLEVGEE